MIVNKNMEDKMRRLYIYIIWVPEQMNGGDAVFRDNNWEFSELMEVMNIQIPEAKHITSRIKERNKGKQKRKKVQLDLS